MAGLLEMLQNAFGGGSGGDPWQGMREVTQQQQPAGARSGGILGAMEGPATQQSPARPQKSPAGFFSGPRGSEFLERLHDMSIGLAMGSNANDSISKAGLMLDMGNTRRKGENKTVSWLKKQGVGQEEADFLAGDPVALRAWYGQKASGNQPEWQITNLFNDKGEEIKAMVDMKTGAYNQIGGAKKAGADATEYGLAPQTGVDAQGNPVLIQLGKNGTSIRTPLPEGVTLSKEPIKLDAGTHFVLLDPITRQPVGQIPKENEAAARDTAIGTATGKAQGEAQIGLGSSLAKADQSIGLIDTMLAHPGLEEAVGASSVWDPRNYMAGTDATNFNVMRKQLEGKAFLEAFESLKGAGQITEVEGQKATEAIARLSTAQSEDAYKTALTELKGILEQGKQRSVQRAGGGSIPDQPQTQRFKFNPATGELQ